jgi:hypothetical protein
MNYIARNIVKLDKPMENWVHAIATYYLSRTGPVQEIFKNYSEMCQSVGT